MTNEEIIERQFGMPGLVLWELLDLARADEREKMQGVDCWISWDEGNFESPTVTTKQPKTNKDSTGRIYHTDLGQNFTLQKEDAEKLGLQQGQCKKFRIVEVLP